MTRRRIVSLACAAMLACVGVLQATADEPAAPRRFVLFSEMMSELSANPAFVEAFLQHLGRDPRAGGILGPEQVKRLREMVLGKHWEGLDRFPALTVQGLGRAVRVAAAALPETKPDAASSAPAPPATPTPGGVEPLGIPAVPPAPLPDTLRDFGFALQMGDRADPARAPRHADAARLAALLNGLSLQDADAAPEARAGVRVGDAEAHTPEGLLRALAATGHAIEIRDARYFADFGDLLYQGREVLTPFWLDTGILVPGTDRTLLVPVSHSQHELAVHGPAVSVELAFYFGIDGAAEWRPNDTLDQSWVMGRVARVYRDAEAFDVAAFAGRIIAEYARVKRLHPELPFGGYYALGVCNDVNAMIELRQQGETTLFPLTLDASLFPADGEVAEIARRLPVDRGSGHTDPARILASLPVDDLAALPIPGLREDAERVRAALGTGTLAFEDGGCGAVGVVVGLAATWLLLRAVRRRRAARPTQGGNP